MQIRILTQLIDITDAFSHKVPDLMTAQESFDVETLNEELINARKKWERSRVKVLEGNGAEKKAEGKYNFPKEKAEGIQAALKELEEMEIPFDAKLQILSFDTLTKQKQAIGFTTVAVRVMKEYLMIPEPVKADDGKKEDGSVEGNPQ